MRWSGKPAACRRVLVLVGDSGRFPNYWARTSGLVGETVAAVEVLPEGATEPFYILDDEGQGWAKITAGGSALIGHRSLDIERVMEEV